jgi:hypothetical protein
MTESKVIKKPNGLPPCWAFNPQGDEAMSPENLSRRSMMTAAVTLAAMPAVAILPAAAAETAASVESPALAAAEPVGNLDAELLAFGLKLESLIADWNAQRAIADRRHRADEAARKRAGLPDIKFGSIPDDEWREYQHKRFKIRGKYAADEDAETNEQGQNVVWNALLERKYPLVEKIYSCKAQTAAGLAVQARAYSLDWIELWDKNYGSEEGARQFADLVCAFAGVIPVALEGKKLKRKGIAATKQRDGAIA